MKNFTKKSILQKTIIAILVVLLLTNFIAPTIILAADDDDDVTADEVGGVLFKPIQYLVTGLGDAIMWMVNSCAFGTSVDPILTLSTSTLTWYEKIGVAIGLVSSLMHPQTAGITISTITAYLGANDKNVLLEIFPEKLDIPIFLLSPEKIFAGEVPLLDANIINPKEKILDANGNEIKYTDANGEEKVKETPAQALHETVASWYVALRNLAIVGLLSVLVYVGIRIIISSTASDKAKYKQMFTDWLIALCLLFFMHYIMSFSLTMVESLTDTIKGSCKRVDLPITVSDLGNKYNISDKQKELLEGMTTENGNIIVDLMGLARFKAQLNTFVDDATGTTVTSEGGRSQMAYTIIYFVLVIYTIMFLFVYLKRLIYIIFLTMMAPMVALSYPIDKMNDGQAQAFNMWLKEYIFNLLIQPLHLLLYMVLLGSAMELATEYLIYPLVVLGFMLPAEKILRKFFGFEKSSTASSLTSGALGGAAVMSAINKISGGTKKAVKGGKGGSSSGDNGNDKIRMAERKADNPDDEDNFIAGALNGPSDEMNQQEEQTVPQFEDNQYDNNAHYLQEYGEQEEPTPEEMAQQDPNFMYMHPELFNNSADENAQKNNNDVNDDNSNDNQVRTQNDETVQDRPDTIYNQGYMTSKEMKDKVTNSKVFKGVKTFGKGVGALGARYVAPNIGKAAKGIVKGTAMAIGAGTLGTIGIAAGLASDDYGNVAKYGAGAAAIGAGVGRNMGNKAMQMPSAAYRKSTEVVDTFRQGAYSKQQYQKFINDRLDKEFMRNKENQALYKEKFGTDKMKNSDGREVEAYKVAMEKAMDYRRQGVTDNDTIIKAMKAKKGNASSDWADRRRIVSAKLASQVSNEKDVENIQKRLKEKGIREPQVKAQADMIREIRGLY